MCDFSNEAHDSPPPQASATAPAAHPESRRTTAAWFVVILLFGVALRLFQLGEASLWLDEAATYRRVSHPLRFLLINIAVNDAHPPAFYLIVHLLTLPFLELGHLEWMLRYPSALAGILTIVVIWMTERRLCPASAFPVATLFAACSAFGVFYAQEARHYVFVGLWVAIGNLAVLRAMSRQRIGSREFLLYFLSMGLALYTFYYALFFWIGHVAAIALTGALRRDNWKRWTAFLAAPILAFLLYVPVILGMKKRLIAAGSPMDYRLPDAGTIFRSLAEVAVGLEPFGRHSEGEWTVLAAIVAAAPLLVLLTAWCRLSAMQRSLVVMVVGPVVCLVFFPFKPHILEAKHLLGLLPVYALCIGQTTTLFSRPPGSGWRSLLKAGVWGILPVVLALNACSLTNYFRGPLVKENWRAAGEFLNSRLDESDIVMPGPFYLEYPLELYLIPEHRERLKTVSELYAEVVDGDGVPLSEDSSYRDARTIWLVELLDSPVSYRDTDTITVAVQGRWAAGEAVFPGRLGTIRLTPYGRP